MSSRPIPGLRTTPEQIRVLYLHGYAARPGGFKPQFLELQGFTVDNPGLPDDNFERSLEIAQGAFDTQRPDVVVGSSRGGAVAMNLNLLGVPLVLIAPAWRRWGQATRVPGGTIILHSAADELIPLADSRELVAASSLEAASLVVVGEEHRMNDQQALAALAEVIRQMHQQSR